MHSDWYHIVAFPSSIGPDSQGKIHHLHIKDIAVYEASQFCYSSLVKYKL